MVQAPCGAVLLVQLAHRRRCKRLVTGRRILLRAWREQLLQLDTLIGRVVVAAELCEADGNFSLGARRRRRHFLGGATYFNFVPVQSRLFLFNRVVRVWFLGDLTRYGAGFRTGAGSKHVGREGGTRRIEGDAQASAFRTGAAPRSRVFI